MDAWCIYARQGAFVAVGVIIIDVRASVERSHVYASLNRLVADLRTAVPAGFFQVAWGDEVEGVLPSPVDLWDLYVLARRSLDDIPCYIGVGFGEISDHDEIPASGSVHELNGTAFKAARDALDGVKSDDLAAIPLAFTVYGNTALTQALNGYPRLINAAFRGMTPKQRTYFEDRAVGYRQMQIAERHGVHQSTVAKELKRAGADQLDCMRTALRALLQFVATYLSWGGQFPRGAGIR
jgi:hypothetical protein